MAIDFFFGVSLTASFMAGTLALFAPCCITFLLPAYLGNIFKNRVKVTFYTLIFALGLGTILIPIALGFRFFIFFFDAYHKQVYYLGAILLILMGLFTLTDSWHLPQIFKFKPQTNKNLNIVSVFGLGLISGLTSSCCAPVLLTAITLTSLTPSLIQALVVSLAYVLGIIFPLVLISLIYEKTSYKLFIKNRQKFYKMFKMAGTFIFILSGVTLGILNYLSKIEMKQYENQSQTIRLLFFQISKVFSNPFIDIFIFSLLLFSFYKLLRKI